MRWSLPAELGWLSRRRHQEFASPAGILVSTTEGQRQGNDVLRWSVGLQNRDNGEPGRPVVLGCGMQQNGERIAPFPTPPAIWGREGNDARQKWAVVSFSRRLHWVGCHVREMKKTCQHAGRYNECKQLSGYAYELLSTGVEGAKRATAFKRCGLSG